MSKESLIDLEGVVTKILKGGSMTVSVALPNSTANIDVTCKPNGRIRMSKIHIVPGDNVVVQVSPYDLTKGLIVWRK